MTEGENFGLPPTGAGSRRAMPGGGWPRCDSDSNSWNSTPTENPEVWAEKDHPPRRKRRRRGRDPDRRAGEHCRGRARHPFRARNRASRRLRGNFRPGARGGDDATTGERRRPIGRPPPPAKREPREHRQDERDLPETKDHGPKGCRAASESSIPKSGGGPFGFRREHRKKELTPVVKRLKI